MKPLRLVDQDEPTRAEIAMAEIEQEHREAKWTRISEPQKSPAFPTDEILARSELRYAIIDRPRPWRRKLTDWIRRVVW